MPQGEEYEFNVDLSDSQSTLKRTQKNAHTLPSTGAKRENLSIEGFSIYRQNIYRENPDFLEQFQKYLPLENSDDKLNRRNSKLENEPDKEKEFSISKKIGEKRDEELLNRSSKMLSDINEVTEKGSSEEVDKTMSKDIFEYRDSKKNSLFHSNNSSTLLNNTSLSKKSLGRIEPEAQGGIEMKRKKSEKNYKASSFFPKKKSTNKKLFPSNEEMLSSAKCLSPIFKKFHSEQSVQLNFKIGDSNFLKLKKSLPKHPPPTHMKKKSNPKPNLRKRGKSFALQNQGKEEINVQHLLCDIWGKVGRNRSDFQ